MCWCGDKGMFVCIVYQGECTFGIIYLNKCEGRIIIDQRITDVGLVKCSVIVKIAGQDMDLHRGDGNICV